jgi:hypothetical protein
MPRSSLARHVELAVERRAYVICLADGSYGALSLDAEGQ